MLYLIDIWSDVDICMLCIVICCHELFRYLDYYLIMIFVWEAWPRLLIMFILLICYAIDVLSLVMTAWSGLSRRLCVVCVYGYGRVSICMAFGSVPFDSVSLMHSVMLWFLLVGVSSLCYVWMQIRARAWWTDREHGGRGLVHVGQILEDGRW